MTRFMCWRSGIRKRRGTESGNNVRSQLPAVLSGDAVGDRARFWLNRSGWDLNFVDSKTLVRRNHERQSYGKPESGSSLPSAVAHRQTGNGRREPVAVIGSVSVAAGTSAIPDRQNLRHQTFGNVNFPSERKAAR